MLKNLLGALPAGALLGVLIYTGFWKWVFFGEWIALYSFIRWLVGA